MFNQSQSNINNFITINFNSDNLKKSNPFGLGQDEQNLLKVTAASLQIELKD